MGVKGLISFCKPIHKRALLQTHKAVPANIGVDAFCLLYLFREERAKFKNYIEELLSNGHTLTLVMDRHANKEKSIVVEERKGKRNDAKEEVNQITSFTQSDEFDELDEKQKKILQKYKGIKERDSWCLYPEYTHWFLHMLKDLKVSVKWAKEEADEYLANGGFDVIISADSDLLVLGVKVLWIPTQSPSGIHHVEISNKDLELYLGFGGIHLLELAYLASCDVQPRQILSLPTAVSWIRFYGSLQNIHIKHPEKISTKDIEKFKSLQENVWRVSKP